MALCHTVALARTMTARRVVNSLSLYSLQTVASSLHSDDDDPPCSGIVPSVCLYVCLSVLPVEAE